MTKHSRLRIVACLALVGGALVGCAQTDGEETTAETEWQPVTIEHALGEAVIESEPERIVTLGQGSAETAIALGTVPVGVEEYPWGSDETGYLPWVHEAVTEADEELPEQFTGATELDIEAIVSLEPDLILAPWSGITQAQFDILNDIAPTVAYEKEPWVITWKDQISVIGEAMGKPDEAKGLIADIEQQLEQAARDDYAGLTFSYIYNAGPGTLGVFFEDEQRVAMVRALGLTVDPVVAELREYEVEGTDSAAIGLENAEKLVDSDLIFTFYSDEANRAEIESQPLYKEIPAVARGSVVAPTDQSFVTGSSIITPLTVPWTLERFVPLIDEAIEKVGR